MPSYKYKVLTKTVRDIYKENTEEDIYVVLGDVDFTKASLTIDAANEEEAIAIAKGIVDIRMWELDSVQD